MQAFAIAVIAAVLTILCAVHAAAHPSDAETLTIDFVFDLRGVTFIDAAANPAQNVVEDALPIRERAQLADGVLAALRIPKRRSLVDATTSERYHEVGFRIYVLPDSTPARTPGSDPRKLASFSSRSLQRLARAYGMERVKLELCPGSDRLGPILELDIQAERPGTPSSNALNERELCTIWNLATTDDPVHFYVKSAEREQGS